MKILPFLGLMFLMSCGYTNPHTPQGHEGYVKENPRVFGNGGFEKVLVGPSNNGFSFYRYEVENIDMRTKTYDEGFAILMQDKLNMGISVQLVASLKPGSIKLVIERFGGVDFYKRSIQKVFRSAVRDSVRKYTSGELKENRPVIQKTLVGLMTDFFADKPILLERIVVGNIEFPKSVTLKIEERLAQAEEEKVMDIKNRIAEKQALIRITEAKGIAASQKIIDKSLTLNYLQFEAIQAQKQMANSPNHTTIYIPVGNNGIPVMRTIK